MVARTVAEFGRLDVIVNNAGVTRYAPIMDLTEADWDRIHRVNAKGVFFCLQRAAREMIRQHQTRWGRRADHQHRLDFRAGLCRRLQRRLCREQGRGYRADQDRGAAARPPQHQRQRDLPGRDPHRIGRPQRRHARRRARHYRGRIAGRTGKRLSRSAAPTPRRTSPRWRCSSPRPAPATLPAKPITSTAD